MDKSGLIRGLALGSGLLGGAFMMAAALADAAGIGRDLLQIGPAQITLMGCGLAAMTLGLFVLWLPIEHLDAATDRVRERLAARGHDVPMITTALIVVPVLLAMLGLSVSAIRAHTIPRQISQPIHRLSEPAPGTVLLGGQAVQPFGLLVRAVQVTNALTLPIGIAQAGDGSHRLFILEKDGRIRILQDGSLLEDPFLDITGRVNASHLEQGLLGLAFSTDYPQSGYFYVNYTDRQGDTIVARYRIGDDPNRADPDSETIVLKLDQPNAMHNGGAMAFGSDGYLYIAAGDGGGAFDPYAHAQNGSTLMGAILRIDVSQLPYRIPSDNPYVGVPDVQDEIWISGLRNPWQFSFDRLTGDLYIGDVGQDRYEEINIVWSRERHFPNFGWPIMEGFSCLSESSCERTRFDMPLIAYDHYQGCAVTGGYVYRGSRYPEWHGTYFFADYCIGRLWAYWQEHPESVPLISYHDFGIRGLAGFGEDEAGEIYFVSMNEGALYQLAASD